MVYSFRMPVKLRVPVEEFLALPEVRPYRELMDGEVTEKAVPTKLHSRTVGLLVHWLWAFVEANPIADVDTELRHLDRLSEWVFLPDVSVTLLRRPGGSDEPVDPVELLPDFAIEVLSPSDTAPRVTRRIAHNMNAGVTLLWLIDPESETVTAWQRGAEPRVVAGRETLDAGIVLPGFVVDLGELFDKVHSR